MTDKTSISVVIPAYNRGEALKRALQSVADQSVSPSLVVVVDDYSEEDLLKIVQEFESDLPILYARLEEKGNANVARNVGIKKCKSDYIALLDSDDAWKPDHLEKSLAFIHRNELHGCFGGITIYKVGKEQRTIIPRQKRPDESPVEYLYSGGLTSTPTMVMHHAVFDEIPFDEALERHQDMDFSIRVFLSDFSIACTETSTTIVHWNSDGTRKVNVKASRLFYQKHHSLFSDNLAFEFHRNMYHSARATKNLDGDAVEYFRTRSKKLAPDLTSYFSIEEPKSLVSKIKSAIEFYLLSK